MERTTNETWSVGFALIMRGGSSKASQPAPILQRGLLLLPSPAAGLILLPSPAPASTPHGPPLPPHTARPHPSSFPSPAAAAASSPHPSDPTTPAPCSRRVAAFPGPAQPPEAPPRISLVAGQPQRCQDLCEKVEIHLASCSRASLEGDAVVSLGSEIVSFSLFPHIVCSLVCL
ncbi:hypothetical protein BRADI_3g19735v3 [Brachypodium distachyon]|uniref:Uncharacterized protein n=1 Tax=Brachypodium distachyon TaxID=15368 RepID=A0A2K2CYB9_BRADI|nr:hypothetical protein BRADI_3g19735v3 [Brachypodium distachyon]PNT67022.1 hypothetical protein BRADI_3g19735v3 [Brachypodium distachyon]PNT67025.1 hypothetical protein BRADI_3g19735v3 [Brachypodium distachyon]PNT67026.1 hypothetical protein BRADI_3g19735v3 [Brachypodium distachyon]